MATARSSSAPRPVLATLVACLTSLAAPAEAQDRSRLENGRPTLRVGVERGTITLDGRLDEPAWSAADSIADLTQTEPVEGATPTGRTVVRVLASADALTIGIRADDPEPARITSFSRSRDARLFDEDHVRIVLDTYLDGRSGYLFAVNPSGARYDALIGGDEENEDWDAVWEAASTRTATGWSAEIRIPAKSLLFRRGLTTWGFNVQRRIQRLQESARWASPDRDFDLNQTSRAGLLTGVPAFDLGIGLSVRPSFTAGGEIPEPDAPMDRDADVSLDATQRLGANVLASLTVNTDFAETEVDERRTNLTRFPLFFPEKRTFFLEGADIFEFGLGTGEDVLPFHSRRIGLLSGRQVPVDVGGKVNGRLGQTNFGALAVRTGRLDTLSTATAMGAIRVRQNVLGESSVGAIATFGDPLGADHSWLGGADLTYRTSRFRGDKNFVAGVWGLAMDREGLGGRRHALGGRIDYPNDLWEVGVTYKWLGDGFLPTLGFVPRPAVQMTSVSIEYQPRPDRPILGVPVRQIFFDLSGTVVHDLEGHWESYDVFTAPLNWQLESGDQIEFTVSPFGERLVEPFEVEDDVVIPEGKYHGIRYGLDAEFAAKRRFTGEMSWEFGDFYSGHLDEIEVTAVWKPSALLNLELSAERSIVRVAGARFTQDVVASQLRVNITADMQLASFIQYDNDSDSFGTNTRFRWTFTPLGDLFVVYNHNVTTLDPLTRDRQWAFESNQLLVKVQYTFRY